MSLNIFQLRLQIYYLLLKGEDVGHTAIDGVSDAGLGFVANCDDGVEAFMGRYSEEELGDVAGSEHLVHRGEVGRAVLGVEVRREDAVTYALSSQELACTTWPTAAAAASSSSSTSHNNAAAAAAFISTHFFFFSSLAIFSCCVSLQEGERERGRRRKRKVTQVRFGFWL